MFGCIWFGCIGPVCEDAPLTQNRGGFESANGFICTWFSIQER